jgi:hypothetical protein
VLETNDSPNIFNMKNQVIHEASYTEEYTARESSIKKGFKVDSESDDYEVENVDEDH